MIDNYTAAAMLAARDVGAVVTTYGERAELCRQVVSAVLREGVGAVTIVDNGSGRLAQTYLREAARASRLVTVLSQGENLGSAAGVGVGIQRTLDCTPSKAVWLLDDDNVPRPGALLELLKFQSELAEPAGLLAYRPRRPYQAALVAGSGVRSAYPSTSSYLSLNVVDILRRRRPANNKPIGATPRSAPIQIPYGAYGGLLIDRTVLGVIGVPRVDMFVYEDDAEYTVRLSEQDIALYLVPTAVIDDIDSSWTQTGKHQSAVRRLLTSNEEGRVYYSTRNRVFFESHYWCHSRLWFRVNKAVWIVLLTLGALRYRTPRRWRVLLSAMADGERGRLGRDPRFRVDGTSV